MSHIPEEILNHIFSYINKNPDRNSASLVCKTWYEVDRNSRHSVIIGNCYAVSPERVIKRFPAVKSLTIKGMPRVGGYQLGPTCVGFSGNGLDAIATNCRFLEHLDLLKCNAGHDNGHWLSCFPESFTSLISLNFSCLRGAVNLVDLEKLVARCPNLRNLRLSKLVPLTTLSKIAMLAPQLVELGLGPPGFVPHGVPPHLAFGIELHGFGPHVAPQPVQLGIAPHAPPQLAAFGVGPHGFVPNVAPQPVELGIAPHVDPQLAALGVGPHGFVPNVAPQPVELGFAPHVAAQLAALGHEIAPQLVELGIQHRQSYATLFEALRNWKSIRNLSLSGSQATLLRLLPLSSICSKMISLDMSSVAHSYNSGFANFVKHCRKLQRLWITGSIGDGTGGLLIVSSTCKDLRDLRLFKSNPAVVNGGATEEGFGCCIEGLPTASLFGILLPPDDECCLNNSI
ncbi:hypothetical protein Vadar_020069 [Vaccinium darrowii]|uniref:Uncharacterized protein n=1 Tax=Vaccinium darrowii TaxID=229202 RepID=A0ACB7X2W2_9ERIC|nr:hypothetical protein Vadar_020069 [Vaccinium darrowii]